MLDSLCDLFRRCVGESPSGIEVRNLYGFREESYRLCGCIAHKDRQPEVSSDFTPRHGEKRRFRAANPKRLTVLVKHGVRNHVALIVVWDCGRRCCNRAFALDRNRAIVVGPQTVLAGKSSCTDPVGKRDRTSIGAGALRLSLSESQRELVALNPPYRYTLPTKRRLVSPSVEVTAALYSDKSRFASILFT